MAKRDDYRLPLSHVFRSGVYRHVGDTLGLVALTVRRSTSPLRGRSNESPLTGTRRGKYVRSDFDTRQYVDFSIVITVLWRNVWVRVFSILNTLVSIEYIIKRFYSRLFFKYNLSVSNTTTVGWFYFFYFFSEIKSSNNHCITDMRSWISTYLKTLSYLVYIFC